MTVQAMTPDEFLEHYGVKGMKWGIRKDREGGSGRSKVQAAKDKYNNLSPEQKAKVKAAAIGAGVLLVTAGAAYAGYKINMNRSVADVATSATAHAGKKAFERAEPSTIFVATRGKEKGFRFLRDGSTPTPLAEYEEAFGPDGRKVDYGIDYFTRYGSAGEKIAARLPDPEGRRDAAGRPLSHDIIVPRSMTDGINSLDDVREKIWPLVKDEYEVLYNRPRYDEE